MMPIYRTGRSETAMASVELTELADEWIRAGRYESLSRKTAMYRAGRMLKERFPLASLALDRGVGERRTDGPPYSGMLTKDVDAGAAEKPGPHIRDILREFSELPGFRLGSLSASGRGWVAFRIAAALTRAEFVDAAKRVYAGLPEWARDVVASGQDDGSRGRFLVHDPYALSRPDDPGDLALLAEPLPVVVSGSGSWSQGEAGGGVVSATGRWFPCDPLLDDAMEYLMGRGCRFCPNKGEDYRLAGAVVGQGMGLSDLLAMLSAASSPSGRNWDERRMKAMPGYTGGGMLIGLAQSAGWKPGKERRNTDWTVMKRGAALSARRG